MVILGLTGSIGMGKTVAAGMFAGLGVPVHSADAAVHRLLAEDRHVIDRVDAAFPGAARDGSIDRAVLGRIVFEDMAALEALEAILHPAVHRDQAKFLRHAALAGQYLAVLDIPLLYETGAEKKCDCVAVVWAPRWIQERRVLSRPGMTRERLAAVRRRQLDDDEKKRLADYLIPSGLGRNPALRAVKRIVTLAGGRKGRAWPWNYDGQ
ncbi:MAG: dephospho-CoA kinase [Rhodospirillales bacterium]|nr:dephospho-CoA kinase [Rhodospirillales bacterium]